MEYKAHLKTVLISYISVAAEMLGKDQVAQFDIPRYQHLVTLLAETVEAKFLMDKTLTRHAIEQMQLHDRPEQATMHCFVLYIQWLCEQSSKHPLEEGVIKQKIINILPMFELALSQNKIEVEAYDKNADALAHIADKTDEVPALLSALAQEYLRLA